jgi:hypothetical protein
MFATARIALPEGEQGLFIPVGSVLTDQTTSSSQVFVVEDGKARAKVVRVGETDGGQIRVLSGVTPGATVATTNLKDLYDSVPVVTQ